MIRPHRAVTAISALLLGAAGALAQVVTGTGEMTITVLEGAALPSGVIEGELLDLAGVATGQEVTSNPVLVASGVTSAPFTVDGPGTPAVSVNGGAWVASGTLNAGDEIRLRQTSSPTLMETRVATLTVGGEPLSWSVSSEVTVACSVSQFHAGAGTVWGFHPDDRITLGVSGYGSVRLTNIPGSSGVSSSGPAAWAGDLHGFCGWTGPVPVEIASFSATGASGDTARIRINEGPEVTSGLFAPGDKLQIVFTASPEFSGNNAFQLSLNGGSGSYSYQHTNVSQAPNVLQPPPMQYTSYPALSVAHNFGNVTVANSATVTSNAWTVPSLTVSKDQWYPNNQPHFQVASDSFPVTGRAYASIDSGLSSAAASSVILRRGATTIASGTEVFPGDQLTIRLTTPISGSGVVRRRLAIQQVPAGVAAITPSPWEVTFPEPVAVSNFEDGYGLASTTVTSNAQTISGLGGCVYNASVTGSPFGTSGLTALVNGSAVSFPSSFTLCDGNTLAIRITTRSTTTWTPFTLTATAGAQSRTFRVSYGVPPMPDTFTALTGATGSTTYTSNALTVSGITAVGGCNSFASATRSTGLSSLYTKAVINGTESNISSFRVCNGDQVALRMRTPSGSFWTPQSMTLTPYTGKTVTWSISR
jgi:hypothetical protein